MEFASIHHKKNLFFNDAELNETNILPLAKGLKAPLSCLSSARYGIAWEH